MKGRLRSSWDWLRERRWGLMEGAVLILVVTITVTIGVARALPHPKAPPRNGEVVARAATSERTPTASPVAAIPSTAPASVPRLESPSPSPSPGAVVPRSSPTSEAPPSGARPPPGSPLAMGWDGVDGQVLMWGIHNFTYPSAQDARAWRFDGKAWVALPSAPLPHSSSLLVTDTLRGVVLLVRADFYVPTVSEWNGRTWTDRPAPGPYPTFNQETTGAYSPDLGRLVILTPNLGTPETWSWTGAGWVQLHPVHEPRTSFGHVAYVPGDHAIEYMTENGELWKFDGTDWRSATGIPASGPRLNTGIGARYGAAVTYDEARSQWVLFGGSDGSRYLDDTWTFGAGAWTRQSPPVSPPGRSTGYDKVNFVYDPVRRVVLLYGGQIGQSGYGALGDTWTWDGARWTLLAA